MAYLYDNIIAKANQAGAQAVKDSGVEPHPFGCGWGWVQVPFPPKGVKSGLATWMKYRNGNKGCDWGYGYGANGGFSYHTDGPGGAGDYGYGQSADQKRVHANAFAKYINEALKDDPGTPEVTAHSKLD